MKYISTLAFLVCFLVSLVGQDYSKFGIDQSSSDLSPLELGTTAPTFKGVDQNGQTVSLAQLNEDGPVLVVFYRGYWCGICQRSLLEFQEEFSTLSSAGVQVVAIAPEVEANIKKTVENNNLEFPVIADSDNSIMKSYQVAFNVTQEYQDKVLKYKGTTLAEINGQQNAILPIPATYLIGKDGTIKYVHYDPDYSKRATLSDILAAL
ncbi:MAG: AhpC/TSA family protein [Saprospiraceae bacterium]|nr:AhpC/TSA family protein [Saprospiraceae bacterium]